MFRFNALSVIHALRKGISVFVRPSQGKPRHQKRNTDCHDDIREVVCSHHDIRCDLTNGILAR